MTLIMERPKCMECHEGEGLILFGRKLICVKCLHEKNKKGETEIRE